jgi:hypothetical protein
MPVLARKLLRKMRGGAQAHLLEAADGHFYVVKFLGNPQHRRILVNEVIASVILKYLQIAVPETALVEVTPEFLRQNPEVGFTLAGRNEPVEPGWHFGSRYPGDPGRMAVYDFVPDTLLWKVNNVSDFLGCLAFDKWTGNADGRQSIFFRAPLADWLPQSRAEQRAHPQKMGFVALMIDHGFLFNGPHWEFVNGVGYGVYMRRTVYDAVTGMESFEPWLGQIRNFPDGVIDQALRQIPPDWIRGEEEELERTLEGLMRRRRLVPELIEELHASKSNPFSNWR